MSKLSPKFIKLSKDNRLYGLDIPIIGLTGGISTGKSTVGKILSGKGLSVLNADVLVKDIYRLPETKEFIASRYSDCIVKGEIDFALLRTRFFRDSSTKTVIESFIYKGLPGAFQNAYAKLGKIDLLIYDAPLLFEKRMEKQVDVSVVVYTSPKIQRQRLMARDGHMENMAQSIMDQQIPIEQKRGRGDFMIDNSGTLEQLTAGTEEFLRSVLA